MRTRILRSGFFVGIMGVALAIGVACGVPQDDFDSLESSVDSLESSLNSLEEDVATLEALAAMLAGQLGGDNGDNGDNGGTTTPPTSGGDDVAFLHGTFDNSTEIQENIASGATLFRIDQQQPLQGYGAVMALTLESRFGIVPASPVTLTGPGLVEAAAQAAETVPTRWFRNGQGADGQNTLTAADVRQQAGQLDFIAIQHAECAYDSFWCVVQAGVSQAASDTGVNVDIRAPLANQEAADALPGLVSQAVAESPDGILLTYTFPNNAAFVDAVESANDAGIPVVAYNAGNGRDEDDRRYLTVYNQDEFEAGRQAATRLIAASNAAGRAPVGVCVNHQVGNTSTDARCRGFNEVFSATSGASVIGNGILATTDDPAASVETLSNYRSTNPSVNVFLTLGPNSAHPYYTFADAEGLSQDTVVHGTFDTSEIINQNIRSGRTLFGIDQQPFLQGYSAVTTLYLNWLFNVEPVPGRSLTGPGFVTTANIDAIPANVAGYTSARQNDVELVFVHHGAAANPWWGTMNDTIGLAAANFGVTVDIRVPEIDEDTDQVADLLTRAAAANADGYAVTISARDEDGTANAAYTDAINDLLAIAPVVAFNAGNGPDEDGVPYRTYIGQTEYQAGLIGGQRLARAVMEQGIENPLAICLNQTPGLANLDARCDGFLDAMEAAGIATAGTSGVLGVGTDENLATTNMVDFFATNPNVNIFFTLGPQVAASFYDFLSEVGLD